MNTCWSRFRCAAVVGCFANTGGSLSLIFGAIGGAVCLPFFACCSVVVFVSSRFRDDGCGGGPVPNEEEDKVVVCPKWGWWSFFLCRGGTPIVDCARPGRDCATRDFVELIVVLVAFVSVFVDISARIARSLDLVWFSRNAPLRLVFDRKRSEGDGEGPPRSRGGRRLFCVAAPKKWKVFRKLDSTSILSDPSRSFHQQVWKKLRNSVKKMLYLSTLSKKRH